MTHVLNRVQISPLVGGYLVLGSIAAIGVLWLLNGGARKTAAAVANVPGQVVAGAVEGIGESIGVPPTNATECQRALRDGRLWDASFACPAGTFIKGIFGRTGDEQAKPIVTNTDSSGVPFY